VAVTVGSHPMSMDAIAALLVERFAGELTDVRIQEPDTIVARCAREHLKGVAAHLKADADAGYETLNWIAGVDRRTSFESIYHVYSWKTNTYLELHVDLPRAKPEVDTVTGIWPAADWHERESWDMVGIVYTGHPDLRRILMWDGYPYFPLRKEFPLEGKPSDMPDVAFTEAAPMEGGPFVTQPSTATAKDREPRARGPI
jgi:NADH-quinone oxidoreductase subunit C